MSDIRLKPNGTRYYRPHQEAYPQGRAHKQAVVDSVASERDLFRALDGSYYDKNPDVHAVTLEGYKDEGNGWTVSGKWLSGGDFKYEKSHSGLQRTIVGAATEHDGGATTFLHAELNETSGSYYEQISLQPNGVIHMEWGEPEKA